MRKRGLLVALALLNGRVAPPPSESFLQNPASSVAGPVNGVLGDPAKTRAVELLDVLNTRDASRIRAFVERSFSAEALKNESVGDRTDNLAEAAAGIRGGSIIRWEKVSDFRGRLIFRNELIDRAQAIGVQVDATPPHMIADWSRPIDLPSQDKPAATDSEVASRLDRFVKRLAKYGYFSGTLLLTRQNKPLLTGAYGLAERNFAIPNQLDTKFQIASMTKMFTAVAIGQLIEQGKLSLDDPLSKFVPDAPGGDRIRLKHLLSHTAGLGDLYDSAFFARNPRDFRSMSDYLRIVDKSPPKTEPGSAWQYSNIGYLYLGKVIEAAAGQEYYTYIQRHVFDPAAMTASGFWDVDYPVSKMAYPYELAFVRGNSGYRNVNGFTGMRGIPSGGAISTVQDMARFARRLLDGTLLKPETLRLFTSPKPELNSPFYGYGFFFRKYPNTSVVQWGHGGNNRGTCTQFTILEDSGPPWVFVTLTNGGIANCRLLYEEASRLVAQRAAHH